MGLLARTKSKPGGSRSIATVVAETRTYIPDDQSVFYISGATLIQVFITPTIIPGREVTIIGADEAGSREIQNSSPTTIPYAIDLGGGSGESIVLADNDVIRLIQLQNGTWLRIRSTDN